MSAVNTTAHSSRVVRAISSQRGLAALAALTLITFFAQLPATDTMSEHGATITEFEFAGTTAKAEQIVDGFGDEGKRAAWTQLAIDMPFLVAYGLLIAGCCLAAADRLARLGRNALARGLKWLAWCGPLAALCDTVQNAALAFILAGHAGQPAPRLAQVFGYATLSFAAIGIVAIGVGLAALGLARLRIA